MAQQISTLIALSEDLRSIVRAQMIPHNCPLFLFQRIWLALLSSSGTKHTGDAQIFMKAKYLDAIFKSHFWHTWLRKNFQKKQERNWNKKTIARKLNEKKWKLEMQKDTKRKGREKIYFWNILPNYIFSLVWTMYCRFLPCSLCLGQQGCGDKSFNTSN